MFQNFAQIPYFLSENKCQQVRSVCTVIAETKADNNSECNDSGMQSFWKPKILERILLQRNTTNIDCANLYVIELAISNDKYSFWNYSYNFCHICVIAT